MRRWMLLALALGGCTPSPGLVMDDAPDGPSVRLEGTIDGSAASLAVMGQGIGDAFGLSLHLRFDDALVAIVAPTQEPVLGEGAVLLERVDGGDVALGGTRPSRAAGEVTIADGLLATVDVRARAGATTRVEIVDAVARRIDGSFVPLAAAGGTLTLEAP